MPKKMVPNPEFEKALYEMDYIWAGGKPPDYMKGVPKIRTNNPEFMSDGMRPEDRIPSHIEVEDRPVGVLEDLQMWFREHPEALEMIKGETG